MNRITVILLAALDAVIALGVGVLIPLVPLTVLWGLQAGPSSDWVPYWRGAADIWLLGHGVDLTVTLDPVTSAAFGLSGQNVFTVTIAALGFALLTALLGSRTGRRAWATSHAMTAAVAGVVTFLVLSALVTLSAHSGPVIPSLLQGSLLPALVFAIGIGVGLAAAELRDRADPAWAEHPVPERAGRLPWPVGRWSASTRAVLAAGLRGGVAASLLLIAAAAVVLAVVLAIGYGRVVGLYETLQPGVLGASALTLAQLALLPNAVVWTASWLVGPGFAVGTGSSVDVAQTTLGPLPNVPLLAVLPQGDPAFGLIAVLVPVLCGVLAGYLTRQRLERMPAPRPLHTPASALRRSDTAAWGSSVPNGGWGAGRLALVALGTAVTSGAVLGLLAWWSSGAIGPGRLQQVGPSALIVAGAVAAEVLIGSGIGIALRRQPDGETVRADSTRVALSDRRAAAGIAVGAGQAGATTKGAVTVGAGAVAGAGAASARQVTKSPRAAETALHSVDEDVPVALAWLDDYARAYDDGDDDGETGARSRPAEKREPTQASDVPARTPSAGTTRPAKPGLARPSAPRVPAPRGRLPRAYREQDFASPEFARHEDADSEQGAPDARRRRGTDDPS